MRIEVVVPDQITELFTEQVSALASQLRGEAIVVPREWLQELIAFPKTWLVAAEAADGTIVGMLTLSAFPRISGWTPWIEGLVVDETVRGLGIGRALMEKALEIARQQSFAVINLSCRPNRKSASRLYRAVGFETVPTSYRRLRL